MQPPPGRAGTRWLTGVLCVLAAGCLFAPAPARAACGEYVTIGGQSTVTGQPPSPEAPGPGSGPGDGRKPCTGPHCSGRIPPAPLEPLIPAAPPAGQDSGLAAATDAFEPARPPAGRRDDATRPRPVRFSPTVYHPPR